MSVEAARSDLEQALYLADTYGTCFLSHCGEIPQYVILALRKAEDKAHSSQSAALKVHVMSEVYKTSFYRS